MRKFLYVSLLVNLTLGVALAHSTKFSYEKAVQTILRYRGKATIALLGDSQIAMGNWNADLRRSDVLVVGKPSFTTEQLIPELKTVSQLNPRVCFIMVGTNDAGSNSFVLNSSRMNLTTLVTNLKRAQVNPVLLTIPYRLKQELFNVRIDSLNQAIRNIAKQESIDLIELGHHLNDGHSLNLKYSFDSIHLNKAGRQLWAGLLQQYIEAHTLN